MPSLIELFSLGHGPGNHFYPVPLHAAIEAIGAVTALWLSHLLHLNKHQPQRGYVLWARCALISMGTLDLFHSVAPSGDDFVWLHSIATLSGGIFFALVWAPKGVSRSKMAPVLPWAVFMVSLAIGLASSLSVQIVPPMLLPDGFTRTATGLNVLGGVLFLAASVWFFSSRQEYRRRRDDVFFALLCLLFGSAGMVFCFSRLWDMEWWIWHVPRSLAYVLATFYVLDIIRLRENTLRASEERYRRLVDNSPDVIYIFSNKRGGIYYSQRVSDYLGYSPEELLNNSLIWHDSIHPENLPAVDALVKELCQGQTYEIEYRIRDRQGNWHWFLDRFMRQSREDDEIIIEGLASDITKRKQAEEALFKRESFLNSIIDQNPYPLWISDDRGTLLRINRACCSMLGIREDEVVGKYNVLRDNIVEEQGRLPLVRSVFEEGKTVFFELEYDSARLKHLQLDAVRRVILDVTIAPVRDDKGRTTNAIIMHQDITARRLAEDEHLFYLSFLESLERVDQAIREAESLEEMLTAVLDTILSIFGTDRAWLLYPCDPEAASWRVHMERTRPEYSGALAIGKEISTTPEVREVFLDALHASGPVAYDPLSGRSLPQVSRQFSVQSQIHMAVHPKMGKPWVFGMHQCSYARVWNEKDMRLFTEVARRITDGLSSLLFLKDLRESERMLTEAQLIAGLGHYDNDLTAGTWTCSEMLDKLFGIGPDFEKTVEGWLSLVHPEDVDVMRDYYTDHMLKQGLPFDREYRIVRANDHAVRWVHGLGRLEHDAAGRPIRMFGTIQDITEHKKTEKALREHAEMQRTLLLEVNHRVKNNLMVIISMLHMEEDRARETGQKIILPLLRDIQGRIDGLLTVHSMLSSAAWKPLKLDLLCEQIARGVIKSYGKEVMLSVSSSHVRIDSDQAHNLTIVLNELATNCLKYAIPAAKHPRIDIAVTEVDGMVRIIFRDNGPGFPANIIRGDYKWAGIGFELIIGIVKKSLRGSISFRNEHGAATNIQFPKTTKTDKEGA